MDNKEQLEQELSRRLTEGEMSGTEPDETAVHRLSPKYKAIVRAETDPIETETKLYRTMAEEVDDRYDKYSKK